MLQSEPHQSPARPTLAVAFCLLLTVSPWAAGTARGEVINRVLLRVNDRIITLFDYELALAERRAQIARSQISVEEQRQLVQEAPLQVMRSLFDRLLVFSRADQLALSIGDLELDEAVRFQREQSGIETEEEFGSALVQSGLTLDQFRSQLRDRLLWERVTGRELYSRIQIEDEELRRVYEEQSDAFRVPEERRLREIVILDTSGLSAEERDSAALRLRSEWAAGGDPTELAEAFGSESATFVDIGWVKAGDLNAELQAVAFELDLGEISEPLESRGGLHVVQNLEIKEVTVKPFEEVRELILRGERSRRFDEELERYLVELEEKSYFRSDLPSELSDFRTKSGRAVREEALQIFTTPTDDPAGEDAENG